MLRGLLHPSEYKKILFQVSQQPKVTYGTEKSARDYAREAMEKRKKELKANIKAKKISALNFGTKAKMTKATDVIKTVNLLTNTGKGTKDMVSDVGKFAAAGFNTVKQDEKISTFASKQHLLSSFNRLRKTKHVVSALSAFKGGLKPVTVPHRQRKRTLNSENTNGSSESTN